MDTVEPIPSRDALQRPDRLPQAGWIGRSLLRREDPRLLRGEATFAADHTPPGCRYLAFVRSTAASARFRIDAETAMAQPGVSHIITGADLGSLRGPAPNPVVPDMADARFSLLATDRVQAVGQPIAAVLAHSVAAAEDTAAAVEVTYDFEAGSTAGREAFRQGWSTGDLPAAFRDAAHIVETTLRHARVAPSALEPRAAVAEWDGAEQRLTIRLSTQTPHRARTDLAALLGLDAGQVRVVAQDVGGAFGGKASLYPEEALVAWAARRFGMPVAWRGTRSEELLSATQGRGAESSGALALGADGALLGMRAAFRFPLGAWLPFSAAVPARNAGRIVPGPYRLDTVAVELSGHLDDRAPLGIYRGAGRPEAAMLLERLMDEAARCLGEDPLEFRKRHAVAPGAMPRRLPSGETLDGGDYPALLDAAARAADYPHLCRERARRRAEGEAVGIGIALYVEPCGHGWESADIRVLADGTISAGTGSTAQGQGRETAFAQIVADGLGVDPADVVIRHGDTACTPPGIGALASRSTPLGGSALLQAVRLLQDRAKPLAARLLQVPESGIVAVPGGFASTGGASIGWAALARADVEGCLCASSVFHDRGEAWSSGCCIAAVRIDRETGVPTVERLVWADDVGAVVNPMLAAGQLIGGMAQGTGEALLERVVYDAEGQLMTGSFMDYALPRAADIPPLTLVSCPTATPVNLLGAKGAGESGSVAVPPAILNAVLDALSPFGPCAAELPLTPEKIWRHLSAPVEECTS